MDKHLVNANFSIGKADAIMYAIEEAYLDIEVVPEERERADRGSFAFYALWDAIKEAKSEFDAMTAAE